MENGNVTAEERWSGSGSRKQCCGPRSVMGWKRLSAGIIKKQCARDQREIQDRRGKDTRGRARKESFPPRRGHLAKKTACTLTQIEDRGKRVLGTEG